MEKKIRRLALAAQKNEITEYYVYMGLARLSKNPGNAKILQEIGEAERRHANWWQERTGVQMHASQWKVFKTILQARILGLTFVLKRMEKNEGTASKNYLKLAEHFPELTKLSEEEAEHEKSLLNMLDEERLQYVGSIVLGLNDALVELTGALAGFTLALADNKLITLAGLVTGISASFSMAASDFLASRAEGDPKAGKSALYTGFAYLITVFLMILPYLLLDNAYISLAITLAIVVIIIFAFNYYLSVAKDLNFKHRFFEMSAISLGVAAFSFGISYLLKQLLGIDI